MKSHEIRKTFLDYFSQNGHTVLPSDSLIPSGDPTLLFTSAGMVQFKKHFLGRASDTFSRAASCQKCFRTSDIENIGRTNRHLTFFEMLGNFSFGDYFKKEAIAWGWEFLTKEMGLPKEKLYATVYKDDNEAYELWKKIVPESKIIRLGDESNFWNMGPTGPCGPCSEILLDLGEELACSKPSCGPGCDCDRYLEIWNLVFTQFDRQPDGTLKNLPRKNIDTGMGLERLTAVAGGFKNIFDTDLFKPIIRHITELLEIDENNTQGLRMMADHARAITLLISDGVMPSNEGRGYVLRRILRRALRQGKLFGANKPFLYGVTSEVIAVMKASYPELVERREHIASITKMEEEKFLETLESGTRILDELISRSGSKKILSGDEVFKLYDTYGFPLDLTREIAQESGLSIDDEGFNNAQKTAQEKSRAAWAGSGEKDTTFYASLEKEYGKTMFEGYNKSDLSANVVALIKNGQKVDTLNAPDEGEVILDSTPFYAESGGQSGDHGNIIIIHGKDTLAQVVDTQKPAGDIVIHKVKMRDGSLSIGSSVKAVIDINRRERIMRHHTATHLLHRALRQVLGSHVTQAGSLVTPDYFRFDFSHSASVTPAEIRAVENIVNNAIRKNMPVCIELMKLDEAKNKGAMALFGEKYSSEVRAVSVLESADKPPFSMELCGGTHVERTGNIGSFKIISESSIAAGTRRIEAVTGEAADIYVRKMEGTIDNIAAKLKISQSDIGARIERLISNQKDMEKEIERLKFQLASSETSDSIKQAREISGIKVIATKIPEMDSNSIKALASNLKDKLGTGIIILASAGSEKVSFAVMVSDDLIKTGRNAGKIAKAFASKIGGSGGGKPDFAQGGGKDTSNLDSTLGKIEEILI